jgi:hypothetical protein
MSITQDSRRNVMLTMRAEEPIEVGPATHLKMNGDKLQWTQAIGDVSCTAIGVLSPATPRVPETINGKMACENGEMTFSLRKKTG